MAQLALGGKGDAQPRRVHRSSWTSPSYEQVGNPTIAGFPDKKCYRTAAMRCMGEVWVSNFIEKQTHDACIVNDCDMIFMIHNVVNASITPKPHVAGAPESIWQQQRAHVALDTHWPPLQLGT